MRSDGGGRPPRLLYGDLMRVFGAAAVIVLHASAGGVLHFGTIRGGEWWLYNAVDSACRWAVPLFIMLSGALLLAPRDSESLSVFYRKRLSRVGIPLLFWSAFYLVYANRDAAPAQAAQTAVRSLMEGTPYYHLYFLFVLLGLYLFVPVFRAVPAYLGEKRLLTFSALALGLASLDALLRSISGAKLPGLSLFVPYIGYFFLGFALRNVSLSPAGERRCRILLLASFAVTALGVGIGVTAAGITRPTLFLYDSFSPTVIGMAVCLFLLLVTAASRPENRRRFENSTLATLSDCTLGIYLIHPVILDQLHLRGINAGSYGIVPYLAITILVPLLTSLGITLLLRRLGPLKVVVG